MNWRRTSPILLSAALIVSLIIILMLILKKQRPVQYQLPSTKLSHPSTEQQYETNLHKPSLVLFYADWCGISKAMMPNWQKLKEKLSNQSNVDIIDIEYGKHPQETKKHEIKGFPTIRFYPEGFPSQNFIEYNGDRSTQNMLNFLVKALKT